MYSLTKFPAADGTPSAPADDQHSRQWCAQNSRGRVRGSATGEVQRPSAPGRLAGESPPPPPVGHRWTIGRRRGGGWVRETAGSGRVSGAVAHLSKQTCSATEGRDRRPNRPNAGYGRPGPTVGRARMMAVGTFDVCSNAAVNSDLSCFLYTL